MPAIETLANENIFIMTEKRAKHQDIRTLQILIVNLMPTVIATETQLLRLLSNTALQLNVEFLNVSNHTNQENTTNHVKQFYQTFDAIKDKYYDGVIITGAPVEQNEFEDVNYWQDLCRIMEWTKSHVYFILIHLLGCSGSPILLLWRTKSGPTDRDVRGIFAPRQ